METTTASGTNSAIATATEHDRTASFLLRLPAELRNAIYLEIFSTPTKTIKPDKPSDGPTPILTSDCPARFLDPLLVCRQIYAEARLIPYSTNTFRLQKLPAYDHFVRQQDGSNLQSRPGITKIELEFSRVIVWADARRMRTFIKNMREQSVSLAGLMPDSSEISFLVPPTTWVLSRATWVSLNFAMDMLYRSLRSKDLSWAEMRDWLRDGTTEEKARVKVGIRPDKLTYPLSVAGGQDRIEPDFSAAGDQLQG